ncbi:MAG: hypothetical protein JWL64_1885, partial [Frankiales bacterium]|nr:hypothetical protein [Frankiales bacterium]
MVDTARHGRIALWGTSDLPGFGNQVAARIAREALTERLPGWEIRPYAPFGW